MGAAAQPGAPWEMTRFSLRSIEFLERDVRLRMPFRFGVVTLTESPQAFVRVRIRLEDGAREAEGAAAELLAPKWFDKNPALSNEDNYAQLRTSLAHARDAYLAGDANSAFGHWRAHYAGQIDACARMGLNSLVACYGPALIDRAALDAMCRALGVSFYQAVQQNLVGAWMLEGLDLPQFFAGLKPAPRIAARHTVGLVDPITAADVTQRVGDGLPETLEEVVAHYGQRYFKLKVGGDVKADLERLAGIASVLDRIRQPYYASLDGNEQYEDMSGVAELWRRMSTDSRLARLVASILFIEQPVKRSHALERPVEGIDKPVIRRVTIRSRRFPSEGPGLRRRVLQDLQGLANRFVNGAAARAERGVEIAALLHVGRGPDHPAGAGAAAGPGAGFAARHYARRAQRPSLRERHGRAAERRAGGVPRRAPGPV
jgi:hypothetical protein